MTSADVARAGKTAGKAADCTGTGGAAAGRAWNQTASTAIHASEVTTTVVAISRSRP